ncbi:Smr/MutS family protein [Larkinella soli]|uniref:Smr/MutS family protein n=1 Tax=Larkinella soli TaxID=1770527 RepID=UPI000FFC29F8|nr:DUF2027 domain-containing protein [Larkinella soli]
MNIGDKIRMLRAKEQGVITRFLPGNQVEIEIEDGFRIPVMRSEIVVVSPLEAARFQNEPAALEPQKSYRSEIIGNTGIYLAFVPQNDREVALHLVNNTDWDLPMTIGEERDGRYTGLQSEILRPRTQLKLNQMYAVSTFENWPTFLFQALWFRRGGSTLREPLIKRLKCRAQTYYKNKKTVPVLNEPGHLFQLDDEVGSKPVEPAVIRSQMLEPSETAVPAPAVKRPSSVVDLHIEKLLPDGFGRRTNAELLEVQLQEFEKSLENAIAVGMEEITFIHGVGNGVLRNEIHRRLGKHSGVRFFEDAQKEKFGYGATKVKIK